MKNYHFLISILILSLSLGCSSGESNNLPLTKTEILENGSPWLFDQYILIDIPDVSDPDPEFLKEVENDVNLSINGSMYIFNQDGTGYSSVPNDEDINFNWEVLNENELKFIYETGTSITFDNITIELNQFSIETESGKKLY